jgi:hypothetical protein
VFTEPNPRTHSNPQAARPHRVDDDTTVSELVPTTRASATEQQRLLALIAAQQRSCRAYLARVKPRSTALTYANIATGAFAAAVTAGPAFGGPGFLDHVQNQLTSPLG